MLNGLLPKSEPHQPFPMAATMRLPDGSEHRFLFDGTKVRIKTLTDLMDGEGTELLSAVAV